MRRLSSSRKHLVARLVALFLPFSVSSAAPGVAAPVPGRARGSAEGRIVLEGDTPRPKRRSIKPKVNPEVCGSTQPIRREDLVVGAAGALANVAVMLAGVTERRPTRTSATLGQKNCTFLPHVQTLTLGSELLITNQDRVIHNVHARLGDQTLFNIGMPLIGVNVKKRMEGQGVTTFSCDSGHTWMKAYVVVVPHSYHATTGPAGDFVIGDILPGAYTLRTWHEHLGVRDTPIVIKAGEVSHVTIRYQALVVDAGRTAPKVPSLDFATSHSVELSSVGEPPTPASSSPADLRPPEGCDDLDRNTANARRAERSLHLSQGRELFRRHCASCHGDGGDGRGEAAPLLGATPRDFTRGEYKLRSTRSDEFPLEDDLVKTITNGIPGTDMPAWRAILSLPQRRVLARYAMALSDRFLSGKPSDPIAVPPEPGDDQASRQRGREVYLRLQCEQCHGDRGDAVGASKEMVDDWGVAIDANDLTRGVYKSGTRAEDLHRVISSGMSGSPMPSFSEVIGPGETWDLVHYVRSLAVPSAFRKIVGLPGG